MGDCMALNSTDEATDQDPLAVMTEEDPVRTQSISIDNLSMFEEEVPRWCDETQMLKSPRSQNSPNRHWGRIQSSIAAETALMKSFSKTQVRLVNEPGSPKT